MKCSNKSDYLLYLVTDRLLMSTSTIEEAVEEAIKGGIAMLQLREKDMGSREFYDEAMRIRELTNKAQIPLIINDRLDIALACDADGLHVGQDDLPVPIARELLGSEKILGVSASNVKEAVEAERDGADYLGVGAMYPTLTKTDASFTSFDELGKIISSVSIPIVVIGGINSKTIEDFANYDISGFAIVSDIIASNTIYQSTKNLKERAELIIK